MHRRTLRSSRFACHTLAQGLAYSSAQACPTTSTHNIHTCSLGSSSSNCSCKACFMFAHTDANTPTTAFIHAPTDAHKHTRTRTNTCASRCAQLPTHPTNCPHSQTYMHTRVHTCVTIRAQSHMHAIYTCIPRHELYITCEISPGKATQELET